jgi:hypothetical protein
MEDSGLLDTVDKFCITSVARVESDLRSLMAVMIPFLEGKNVVFNAIQNPYATDEEMILNLESDKTVTENATMRWIYEQAKHEDLLICYAHTKGITSLTRHLLTGNGEEFMKYYYWRQYLNWGVFEKWKDCLDALDQNDVAGVNYRQEPSPHFSGSFWWTKSSHIRTLPDPSTLDWWHKLKQESPDQWLRTAPDRYRDEQWICSRPGTKAIDIYPLEEKFLPTTTILKRKTYDAKTG